MPHCNDEEAGGIKQKHDNEQIAYSGYLIDTFETSDDNVDSDNNCLIENSTKEEIFENPFKNETWFNMKKLDENSATRSTAENICGKTSATTTSKIIANVCKIDITQETENILKIGKSKRKYHYHEK
jgi:hypothetical protein